MATLHPFRAVARQPEWAFLCASVSPSVTSEEILASSAARIDWEVLLNFAEAHGVLGVLSLRLRETNFVNVPSGIREILRERMRAQHLFALSMSAELLRLLAAFRNAGIEPLAVKGPVLSESAYGDPSVRSFADLDLILRQCQILTATQLMERLGFEARVSENAIRAAKIPGEYVFRRPGTRRMIEIHSEGTLRYYPKPLPIEEVYARRRSVLLDGHPVPALSLEDELLFDCVHGAKDLWQRLIWIADVAWTVARHPQLDWTGLQQRARQLGAQSMLLAGLRLAEHVLGLELPGTTASEIANHPEVDELRKSVERWLPSAGARTPGLFERARFRMKMYGGGPASWTYLLRLSLSPTEADWSSGPAEQNSWLWSAVKRPLRLIRKYGHSG